MMKRNAYAALALIALLSLTLFSCRPDDPLWYKKRPKDPYNPPTPTTCTPAEKWEPGKTISEVEVIGQPVLNGDCIKIPLSYNCGPRGKDIVLYWHYINTFRETEFPELQLTPSDTLGPLMKCMAIHKDTLDYDVSSIRKAYHAYPDVKKVILHLNSNTGEPYKVVYPLY